MEATRYLLPFTGNINVKALRHVLQMAKTHDVTLVVLVLIPLTKGQKLEEVRLEYLQQAQDFLSTVLTYAEMYSVQVETYERYTYDVCDTICSYTKHLGCQCILLSREDEKTYFLSSNETKKLQVGSTHTLIMLYERSTYKQETILMRLRSTLSTALTLHHVAKNSLSL